MTKKTALLFFALVLLYTCTKTENTSGYTPQPAYDFYERIMEEEAKDLPDFSCPPVLVPGFTVEGAPDHLRWYTSSPKDYSSKALKKGGNFYSYIPDIPNTFRYAGPGADELCEKLFGTNMPLLWKSFETAEFMPAAATHWACDIKEKTAYYKLHEKMRWSDGEPCTADDWIFAQRFLSSASIIDLAKNRHYRSLSITKINDFCIAVRLLNGNPVSEYALLEATNFKPVARHFYKNSIPENWAETYNRIPEPTTGPYMLAEYDYNHGLKFTKVQNWWAHEYPHFKGVANFDAIFYRIITGSKNPVFTAFSAGAVDTLRLKQPAEQRRAEQSPAVTGGFADIRHGYYAPAQGPAGLFFNTTAPPFNRLPVRQGMRYALNIDGLIETAFSDGRKRLHSLGAGQEREGAAFNNESIKAPAFNPHKARELFAQAGYTNINANGILANEKGEELSFTVFYEDEAERDILGFLYAEALKAGVRIEFKYFSGGLAARIASRNFQAWWGTLPALPVPDNYPLLHSSYADKKTFENFFGYSDPKLDALLEQYENAPSYAQKAAVNCEIEIIADEAALMVSSYYDNSFTLAAWKWICFPAWFNMKRQPEPEDPMFGYLWFDPAIEAECRKAMEAGRFFEKRIRFLSGRYK